MSDILDRIDEANNLTELKEFAKKCKIKSIELEKSKKVFESFLDKYRTSSNNIYDISVACKSMIRNINKNGSNYTEDEIIAFYVAFCKQVRNYDESNPLDHAYMYYVLYFAATIDGDKSGKFIENVKEVVANAKSRNNL
jgi:hypothetical protein